MGTSSVWFLDHRQGTDLTREVLEGTRLDPVLGESDNSSLDGGHDGRVKGGARIKVDFEGVLVKEDEVGGLGLVSHGRVVPRGLEGVRMRTNVGVVGWVVLAQLFHVGN